MLPLYLAGEASAGLSPVLIEEFLKQDPELARSIRSEWMTKMNAAAPSTLPSELELRAFRKTKRMIGWQKWLIAFAILFTSIAGSVKFTWSDGRFKDVGFALQGFPEQWAILAGLAAAFWIAYFALRRRLRTTAL